MTVRSEILTALVAAQVVLLVATSLVARGFALVAISDLIQLALLLCGTLSFLANAYSSPGRTRIFWALLSCGMGLWLFYQCLWTYFEVVLRSDVPDLFWGDIVIFLHIVPMMAALAIQPHLEHEQRTAKLGTLDFALLIVWWLYLYMLMVLPWQYAVPDIRFYNRNLNVIYAAEKLVFLAAVAVLYLRSNSAWKKIFANLFGASLTYALSSYLANWAIGRNIYHSGSVYDVPLVLSMAWMAIIALHSQGKNLQHQTRSTLNNHGVWVARLGMGTISSLPFFAIWFLYDNLTPPAVRDFRLVLTLACMLVMGAMVFVRQYLLDKELVHLLHTSQGSFENLRHLQTQLVESEKLASLGQLVAGAAHELNNPLTAMLGYSDLLSETALSPEQRGLTEKIGYQVRSTRALIASLINFARQSPAERNSVDLGALAQTAVNLARPQFEAQRITVKLHRQPDLQPVFGDSNQLLQVCTHIVNSGVNAISETGGALEFRIFGQQEFVVLEMFERTAAIAPSVSDPFYSSGPSVHASGLGLTACMGIIQDHRGTMVCENNPDGSAVVRIQLPVAVRGGLDRQLRSPLTPQSV